MLTQEVDLAVAPAELLQGWAGEPHSFLLDGGGLRSWGDGVARFGARPVATLAVFGDGRGLLRQGERPPEEQRGQPFVLLDRFRARYSPTRQRGFSGVVVVALSYDLSRLLERLAVRRRPSAEDLVLFAAAYPWMLSYSYAAQRYRLMIATGAEAQAEPLRAELCRRAARPRLMHRRPVQPPQPELDQAHHIDAVRQALRHIKAGDIYQVNLAQRFHSANAPPPNAAFTELQRMHPMPYGAYFDLGATTLVCNSPECLIELEGRTVATYPIKGTRRRDLDDGLDRELVAELRRDPKECAEHVMIVDLERNDLGRVCRPGTIQVDRLMEVESFGSLHHLVSRISGQLEPQVDLAEVLRAMFPGGSITGAPKIRATEIIDELEPCERGFYTGAIGYICGERAVFNIAIRTAIVRDRQLWYYAGGGIVADSDPMREYQETLLKAQPFLSLLAASPA
ncbi:MAG TPA: anthranilate synthase component I family protein [Terriglobales bacterium]|nr:anthranilate synthase component I family protein [Terriglobales bacterium]